MFTGESNPRRERIEGGINFVFTTNATARSEPAHTDHLGIAMGENLRKLFAALSAIHVVKVFEDEPAFYPGTITVVPNSIAIFVRDKPEAKAVLDGSIIAAADLMKVTYSADMEHPPLLTSAEVRAVVFDAAQQANYDVRPR